MSPLKLQHSKQKSNKLHVLLCGYIDSHMTFNRAFIMSIPADIMRLLTIFMQDIPIIIYQQVVVSIEDIQASLPPYTSLLIGHFKGKYRQDRQFKLRIYIKDNNIVLKLIPKNYGKDYNTQVIALIEVICKETGDEYKEIHKLLQLSQGRNPKMVPMGRSVWDMLSLSDCENLDILTFLCFVDIIQWNRDRIRGNVLSNDMCLEYLWLINKNRLKQFLKNKNDKYMYSPTFRKYNEFCWLKITDHRKSGTFKIHLRIYSNVRSKRKLHFEISLHFDNDTIIKYNGITTPSIDNYKLYPSDYCQYWKIFERNVTQLQSVTIKCN